MAKEAVAIADSTQGLMWKGNAYQDLAIVMRLLGRRDDEAAALREAVGRYEAKGVRVEADRLHRRLEELGSVAEA